MTKKIIPESKITCPECSFEKIAYSGEREHLFRFYLNAHSGLI